MLKIYDTKISTHPFRVYYDKIISPTDGIKEIGLSKFSPNSVIEKGERAVFPLYFRYKPQVTECTTRKNLLVYLMPFAFYRCTGHRPGTIM